MTRYENRIMKNNVFATLSTAISSIGTTIQVTTWQWQRFWNDFPQIATLESFDWTWKVVKREIVEITWRTNDAMTVVRAFAPCPSNDDANTQSQSSFSFSPDDKISLYIPKEIFDRISASINDLYNNWNDRLRVKSTWWLNIEVTEWNARIWTSEIYFAWWTATLTDNATNYVELTGAWLINVSTIWRDTKFCKLAKIVVSSGEITSFEHWKMDTVGGVMSASAGFKNISNCVYNWKGELIQFVADSVTYNLTYELWMLKTISFGEALYTMTYQNGKLVSAVES